MCFAGGEDAVPSRLNDVKDIRKDHLLDRMNAGNWNEFSFNYVKAGALQVKEKLTGPESTYILRDLFNFNFYSRNKEKEVPVEERIYGTILYRREESTVDYSFFKLILRDYVNCNIKKILNMDIDTYLHLTPYEKMVYDEFSLDCSRVINEEVERMEKDNERNIKRATAHLDNDALEDL